MSLFSIPNEIAFFFLFQHFTIMYHICVWLYYSLPYAHVNVQTSQGTNSNENQATVMHYATPSKWNQFNACGCL